MAFAVVVINLDRDVERLAHMKLELSALSLDFVRFPAIEGAKLPAALLGYFESAEARLTPGEIGCYASHLEICRRVVAGELLSPLLVLEDDVELSQHLPLVLDRLIETLPAGWDIVRLAHPSKRAQLQVAELSPAFDLVRYSHVPTSTGAYLLSRSGAVRFLRRARRLLPVDQDLRRVWRWRLRTYGVAPPPVRRDCLGSSSIDALAPGVRASAARGRRMRQERWLEAPWRHAWGLHDFGSVAWLTMCSVNLVARLTPKRQRRRLFEWAQACLISRGNAPSSPRA